VTGVRVATHAETPGVGSVVADEPSAWREGFTGRGAGQPPPAGWALHSEGGDFDAIAGATVSSRAVVGGVHGAVQYFAAHRARIFATPGESTRP
jgi:electron transport complex protein RnfG